MLKHIGHYEFTNFLCSCVLSYIRNYASIIITFTWLSITDKRFYSITRFFPNRATISCSVSKESLVYFMILKAGSLSRINIATIKTTLLHNSQYPCFSSELLDFPLSPTYFSNDTSFHHIQMMSVS